VETADTKNINLLLLLDLVRQLKVSCRCTLSYKQFLNERACFLVYNFYRRCTVDLPTLYKQNKNRDFCLTDLRDFALLGIVMDNGHGLVLVSICVVMSIQLNASVDYSGTHGNAS